MKINFFRIEKRPVVLVELLIAMALTMAILILLLGFYDQIDRMNNQADKEQRSSFQNLYLSTRLAAVLPKAIAANNPDKDFLFFTTSIAGPTALLFTFDNGVKLDPLFSNHVVGCLYVNSSKQLCLATWPSPARWEALGSAPPMKNEILFHDVDRMGLEFFVPPTRNRDVILSNSKGSSKIEDPLKSEITTSGEWKHEWMQEYKALPAIVRIELILKDGNKLVLVYPLPLSPFIILYDTSVQT